MPRKSLKARFTFSLVFLLVGAFFGLMLLVLSNKLTIETAFAQQNLIRLHVIANSNLPKDQDLKLMVRDAVLQETMNIFGEIYSKEQAQILLADNRLKIQEIAQEVVLAEGFDYPVQVQIGHFPFPERIYGSLSLPEGWYDAVRIEIGDAIGDNWWCVLFPPLCLADLEGANSNLVQINKQGSGNRFVFRSKLWDHVAQTRYAHTFQKWWQASAASYPSLSN